MKKRSAQSIDPDDNAVKIITKKRRKEVSEKFELDYEWEREEGTAPWFQKLNLIAFKDKKQIGRISSYIFDRDLMREDFYSCVYESEGDLFEFIYQLFNLDGDFREELVNSVFSDQSELSTGPFILIDGLFMDNIEDRVSTGYGGMMVKKLV